MAWKNLAQTHLSEALVRHHEALEELDGIGQLMGWSPPEINCQGCMTAQGLLIEADEISRVDAAVIEAKQSRPRL